MKPYSICCFEMAKNWVKACAEPILYRYVTIKLLVIRGAIILVVLVQGCDLPFESYPCLTQSQDGRYWCTRVRYRLNSWWECQFNWDNDVRELQRHQKFYCSGYQTFRLQVCWFDWELFSTPHRLNENIPRKGVVIWLFTIERESRKLLLVRIS